MAEVPVIQKLRMPSRCEFRVSTTPRFVEARSSTNASSATGGFFFAHDTGSAPARVEHKVRSKSTTTNASLPRCRAMRATSSPSPLTKAHFSHECWSHTTHL